MLGGGYNLLLFFPFFSSFDFTFDLFYFLLISFWDHHRRMIPGKLGLIFYPYLFLHFCSFLRYPRLIADLDANLDLDTIHVLCFWGR